MTSSHGSLKPIASKASRPRAIAYARYSSDAQRDASIEDQLRVCRVRAEREGWTLGHTYVDHATSGATNVRKGYQAMLSAVRDGGVDIVVAESLDRFSRDLEHTAALFKQAAFHGARIHTLAEGDVSELHVGLKGVMGALYLKDLADKTRRGLEGRVHAGRCVGSAAYGYQVVRRMREDGEPDRGLRAIDPDQAAVVQRIFSEYAAGISPLKIAKALNAEAITGPGGGIWYDTSIRGRERRRDGILRNALYVGSIVWRRRLNLKDPATGARLRRDATPDSYVTGTAPELRIITDDLWERTQARLRAEAAAPAANSAAGLHAFWDQRRPRHLLSGKVVCATCGGPFRNTGSDYLGCSASKQGACSNSRTLRRATLEAHVMDILARQLMRPELLATFVAAFNKEWETLESELHSQAAGRRREQAALDRKIGNLVDVVSAGRATPAILSRLEELEAQRAAVRTVPTPDAVRPDTADAGEMATTYADRIADLTAALSRNTDPEALELARRLIDQVIVHPGTDTAPNGIEFIGNLIDLLAAAGLGSPGRPKKDYKPESVLALFVSSVKEGPGAEPLAFSQTSTRSKWRSRTQPPNTSWTAFGHPIDNALDRFKPKDCKDYFAAAGYDAT